MEAWRPDPLNGLEPKSTKTPAALNASAPRLLSHHLNARGTPHLNVLKGSEPDPPQWSPPLNSGSTHAYPRRWPELPAAAMEPAVERREHAGFPAGPCRGSSNRNGARLWTAGARNDPGSGTRRFTYRNGARRWTAGARDRAGLLAAIPGHRNGARRWTAGARQSAAGVKASATRPQWSPPLDGGSTLNYLEGAGWVIRPQWSPPLDGGSTARKIRAV